MSMAPPIRNRSAASMRVKSVKKWNIFLRRIKEIIIRAMVSPTKIMLVQTTPFLAIVLNREDRFSVPFLLFGLLE
jgi:hypothetical protein